MKRFLIISTSLLITTSFLALIVIGSPFIASWIAGTKLDWAELGNVGEVYGLTSAILSGFAFLSIFVTLTYQVRQTATTQQQAARSMQLELYRLAYEYPDLKQGWRDDDLPHSEWRLRTYINLIIMYLRMLYLTGAINERELRRTLANRFRTQPGKDFWRSSRSAFMDTYATRKEKKFVIIADEEYQKALKNPRTESNRIQHPDHKSNRRSTMRPLKPRIWASAACLMGLAIFARARSRRR